MGSCRTSPQLKRIPDDVQGGGGKLEHPGRLRARPTLVLLRSFQRLLLAFLDENSFHRLNDCARPKPNQSLLYRCLPSVLPIAKRLITKETQYGGLVLPAVVCAELERNQFHLRNLNQLENCQNLCPQVSGPSSDRFVLLSLPWSAPPR